MQEIGYRVNLRTRECEKFRLTEKFDPVEVPASATLDNTVYLGAKVVPENNVEMNFYSGHTEEGNYKDSQYLIVIYDTIAPVRILSRCLDSEGLFPLYPLLPVRISNT